MVARQKSDAAGSYGIALIERSVLRDLKTVWEGPLDPAYLQRVEIALRAFLVAQVLTVSRAENPWEFDDERILRSDDWRDWEPPFGDHLLDYEFTHPGKAHPLSSIDASESTFLTKFTRDFIQKEALDTLPKSVINLGQAMAYLDTWYSGDPAPTCLEAAFEMSGYDDESEYHEPWTAAALEESHAVFHLTPARHAHYLVGTHRAGLTVYGNSPVVRACNEHLFSSWPEQIFRGFDSVYRDALRSVRGPGIAVDLPPLLAVLLSRAESRSDIPAVLRDLREQYADSRRKLWQVLEEMWEAPTLEKQLSHARELTAAASSIFGAAFPQKVDVLDLGLSVAQLTPSGAVQALRAVRERDKPNARVSAVSFAKKLAIDLRTLENARVYLKRHLTASELAQFGM